MARPTIADFQKQIDRFNQLYQDRDFKTIADKFYTSDCRFMGPNTPIVIGKEAQAKQLEDISETYASLKAKPLEVVDAGGDIIIERGSYQFFDEEGTETDVGKYVTVRKQENGQWPWYIDIWNSDKA